MFTMKKYLLTLIVAASAVIHAHAADLASQVEGYWKPDMEQTPALAMKANRELDPMAQAMMGKMVFEFQKDKMIVHGPPGFTSVHPAVPFHADIVANQRTMPIFVEAEAESPGMITSVPVE
jgi:hypothetical protein